MDENKNPKQELIQPEMSPAASAKRLLGISQKPKHLSGVKRDDMPVAFYTSDPDGWPTDSQGNLIPQINWCGQASPIDSANLHYMVAGVPGTGKTITFRALVESVFSPHIKPHLGGTDRAILYDPKQEFFPILHGIGVPADDIILLNPFDRRSHAWDLAADYRDNASFVQLAKTLIPCGEQLSQPFFPKAAATVLAAVIGEHARINPGKWELADVIFDCLSEKRLLARIDNTKTNPYNFAAKTSLAEGNTRASVLAELTSNLTDYLPLAACWKEARKQGRIFSVRDFLEQQNQVVLLGANRTYSESLSTMNRLFLRRFSELALDNLDDSLWNSGNRTWLFLDELKELGKVYDLASLISKGRSKGICTVLGFQDFSGLKSAFGENNANEITACCHQKIFFRLAGESAEWASNCIGQTEIIDTAISLGTGSQVSLNMNSSQTTGTSSSSGRMGPVTSTSTTDFYSQQNGFGAALTTSSNLTITKQSKTKSAVLPSDISGLPVFKDVGGITGFVVSSLISDTTQESVARKFFIPAQSFSFLNRNSLIRGFEAWNSSELDW